MESKLRKKPQISGLFYITHIDNIPSILRKGIYCHDRIEREHIEFTPIYDKGIVSNRKGISTPDGRTLWNFTNLYFQPRNPMLYRVINEKPINDIAVISVSPEILDRLDVYITTGNAAHSSSKILPIGEGLKSLSRIKKETNIEYWKEQDGSKRKIMAECLVPDTVPPNVIQTIYVATRNVKENLEKKIPSSMPIVTEPNMFFHPLMIRYLTNKLYLAEGDMFFSKAQTITISVNTVGVMGKGLASRTRYQFPDVYVYYEDLCKKRRLTMGNPKIYKRESSLDYELSDDPGTLTNGNSEKWFLLFPTKRHWRENSDISGIEEGLRWLSSDYTKEGIKSLAIPALGCGLGKLEWKDVGPIMCKYLAKLDITVAIYLPAEKHTPKEYLSSEYLLG